jgi:ketopantoate hydroxymethyltransferase
MREYDQTSYRFFENEAEQSKDVMLTAYDYPSAKHAEQDGLTLFWLMIRLEW